MYTQPVTSYFETEILFVPMNSSRRYHTHFLIGCGYLQVILPTVLLLFAPLLYIIFPDIQQALQYPLRLLGAMAAGLLFSFLYYRFIAPRWVRWAVQHAADLPALKRKMRVHRLLPDGLLVNSRRSGWLQEDVKQQLQQADINRAIQDDPAIPEQLHIYQVAYYRLLGWIAILLFAASVMVLIGLLPSDQWWQITGFAPLLIGGLVLLPRRNSKVCLLTLTATGLTHQEQSWSWDVLGEIQFEVRHNWHGSPAHSGYVVNTHKFLRIELLSGGKQTIDLSKALIRIDLEEYIAVYRYRHSQQRT